MNTDQRSVRTIALLVAGSMALAWGASLLTSSIAGSWDNRVNDTFFRLRYAAEGPEKVSRTVGFIDLSDQDAQSYGVASDDRAVFARLLNVLAPAGVDALIFDIVFPEGGTSAGDRAFARASAEIGNVYMPIVLVPRGGRDGLRSATANVDPIEQSIWHPVVLRTGDPIVAASGYADYRELAQAARGLGHVNSEPDRDGIFRRVPLLIRYRDGYIPNIAFRAACDVLQVSPNRIEVSFGSHIRLPDAHLSDGSIRTIDIPIDDQGRMIVDFAAPWGHAFPHYSFAKLLAAEHNPAVAEAVGTELEGMQLVVSDVTTSSGDYGPVPYQSVYPLSGLHANILNSILTDRFLRPPPVWMSVVSTVLFALVLWLILIRSGSIVSSIAALLLWCLFTGLQFGLFVVRGVMPQVMEPTVGFVIALVVVSTYRFFASEREKLALRLKFERYFAPKLMSKILKSPARLMTAEQKVLTVLFSDISNFTSWCSSQPPDRIRDTLNEYFGIMSEIVFRHEGTIDKFIGDGLMAFFGDPLDQPDHSVRAVRAAIEMQLAVRRLREEWSQSEGLPIHIRIGINAGEVVVGDMGSDRIMAYTAIGSHVNLSSRLEGKAPIDGILISEAVYRSVKDQVATRYAGKTAAKGIRDEFDTYEVVVP